MTLCVQSKHTLDELEEFVRDSFSSVQKRETAPLVFPKGIPFTDNPDFFKLLKIVPMKHHTSLAVYWPLPSQKQHYREQNLDYLGYAIGHEGRNSILDHLRRKQWAIELEAGSPEDSFYNNEMYSMFEISLTLTEEGAKNLEEVIRYIHQYIGMLRKKGPQEWLWKELKGIAENDFRFEEEMSAHSYVSELCVAMQNLPPEHYLCGYDLYFDYNPKRLQSLMDLLTPENCCIIYVNSEFQKETNLFPLKEPFMGVPYKIEDFSDASKALWVDDAEFQTRFELPEPNKFVATNFALVEDPDFADEVYPTKIHCDANKKLWFRKDGKFQVPKLYISAHLINKVVHCDVKAVACTDIAIELFDQVLAQVFNYAEMASLCCDICDSHSGLALMFSGFSEKLPLLCETVTERFTEFDFSEEQFRTIAQNIRKTYYNALYCVGYADEIGSRILHKNFIPFAERREMITSLVKQDVLDQVARICKSSYLEMYVHGNATSEEALNLMSLMASKLAVNPTDRVLYQSFAKIEGSHYIRFLALNPKDENSRIINYYQHGPVHLKESTLMQLLEMLIDEKCYDELRTKQQVGYDVSLRLGDMRGVVGFSVAVSPQASKFTLTEVDERIDKFMASMATFIENLSKEEFETACESLIQVKSCADLAMGDEHNRNWGQIRSFDYCFDVLQIEVQFLRSLKREQFVKWAQRVFHPPGGIRKLSVQLVGFGEKALEECEGGDEIWRNRAASIDKAQEEDPEIPPIKILLPKERKGKNFITDLEEFKKGLQYYEGEYRDPHKPVDF